MHYLLPCECGAKIPIQMRQAGEEVSCPACEAKSVVPTMRGIRDLELVKEEAESQPQKPPWTRQQGMVFASGVLLAIAATIVAIALYLSVKDVDTAAPKYSEEHRLRDHEAIDAAGPDRIYVEWQTHLRRRDLGRWHAPQHVANRQYKDRRLLFMKIAVGCAALGCVIVVGSFFMRPRVA